MDSFLHLVKVPQEFFFKEGSRCVVNLTSFGFLIKHLQTPFVTLFILRLLVDSLYNISWDYFHIRFIINLMLLGCKAKIYICIYKKETDTWKISGCVLRGRSLCAGMMRRWKGQSLWPPTRPSWHSELEEVDSRSLKTHIVEADVSMWNILDYTGRDYGLAEDGNRHWRKMMFRKARGGSYRQNAGRERREKITKK